MTLKRLKWPRFVCLITVDRLPGRSVSQKGVAAALGRIGTAAEGRREARSRPNGRSTLVAAFILRLTRLVGMEGGEADERKEGRGGRDQKHVRAQEKMTSVHNTVQCASRRSRATGRGSDRQQQK